MIEIFFPKANGTTQLRMPGTSQFVPDDLGISWQGPVLNGDQSVEQRRRQHEHPTLEPTADIENLDPVLRFHCRL